MKNRWILRFITLTLLTAALFAPRCSAVEKDRPNETVRIIVPTAYTKNPSLDWQRDLMPGLLRGVLSQLPRTLILDSTGIDTEEIWRAASAPEKVTSILKDVRARHVILLRLKKGTVDILLTDSDKGSVEFFSVKSADTADFNVLCGILKGLKDKGMALPSDKGIKEKLKHFKYSSSQKIKLYVKILKAEGKTPPVKLLMDALTAMKQNPGFLPARDLYGRILARAGSFEKARKFYGAFLEPGPYSLQSYLDYGLLLASKKRYLDASMLYNRGLLVYPRNIMLLYNQAYVLEKAGRPDGAERAYMKILEMDPENDAARYNLGALYYSRGYYGRALPMFEQLEADNPGNPYFAYQSASALLGMGRMGDAEVKLRALAEKGPFKEVFNDLGLLERAKGNYPEALKWFDKALSLDPRYGAPLNNGAVVYMMMNDDKKARQWLEKALLINPSYGEALYNLGLLEMRRDNFDRAWLYFYRVTQTAPEFYQARINMAICRVKMGKAEEALSVLEDLIKEHGDDRLVLYNLGVVYRMTGQWAKALACFEKVLSLYPAFADAIINASAILINSRQFEKAFVLLDHGLSIYPSSFAMNFNRGIASYHQGDFKKASVHLKKALEQDESRGRVRRFYIRSLLMESRFDEAKIEIDTALKEDPSDYVSRYLLAVYFQRTGNPGKAADIMERMLASMDYHPDGYLNLARLYMWMKEYGKAAVTFEKILSRDPENGECHLNLGTALIMEKKYNRALTVLKEARRLMPADSRPLHHMGVLYIEKKEFGRAASLYRQALSLEPANDNYLSNLALCLAFDGNTEEAVNIIKDGIEMYPKDARFRYLTAVIYAVAKDRDNVLKYLKEAVSMEPALKIKAASDEDLKEYFNDEDFKAIIRPDGGKNEK